MVLSPDDRIHSDHIIGAILLTVEIAKMKGRPALGSSVTGLTDPVIGKVRMVLVV